MFSTHLAILVNFLVFLQMSQEAISLAIIAAIILSYAQITKPKDASTVLIPSRPSQQREVDVTRWRHDGTQPVFYTKGNGPSYDDETVIGMKEILSM